MREQPGILEDHAAAPPLRRQGDAARGVQQHGAVQRDPPGLRPQQPGDGGQHGGLAAAGGAEQRRHPRLRRGEGDIEREAGPKRWRSATSQHQPRPSSRCIRRAINSASSSPASGEGEGDAGQPRRHRLAARGLGGAVDRQRQGLGLARDVGGEGDDRAEFAQARGEGGDRAGQDAGRHQRQGDGRGSGPAARRRAFAPPPPARGPRPPARAARRARSAGRTSPRWPAPRPRW